MTFISNIYRFYYIIPHLIISYFGLCNLLSNNYVESIEHHDRQSVWRPSRGRSRVAERGAHGDKEEHAAKVDGAQYPKFGNRW